MLIDRETDYAIAATGAFDRIMNHTVAETEEYAIKPAQYDPAPTMYVTYVGGEIRYRGFNMIDAWAVAAEHTDDTLYDKKGIPVEFVVEELPFTMFQSNTHASMPLFGTQWHDDIERGAIAPLTIDALLGYADLTTEWGESVGHDLHPYEWEDAFTMFQQDLHDEDAAYNDDGVWTASAGSFTTINLNMDLMGAYA